MLVATLTIFALPVALLRAAHAARRLAARVARVPEREHRDAEHDDDRYGKTCDFPHATYRSAAGGAGAGQSEFTDSSGAPTGGVP